MWTAIALLHVAGKPLAVKAQHAVVCLHRPPVLCRGLQNKTFMILTPAEAGGAACDHENGYVMVAACNEDACPAAVSVASTGILRHAPDAKPAAPLLRATLDWRLA